MPATKPDEVQASETQAGTEGSARRAVLRRIDQAVFNRI
jgi:hypothetical protein